MHPFIATQPSQIIFSCVGCTLALGSNTLSVQVQNAHALRPNIIFSIECSKNACLLTKAFP